MLEEFLRLREQLERGGPVDEAESFDVRCHQRLARALRADDGARLGEADLVALVAHVLRRHESTSRNVASWLRLPAAGTPNRSGRRWPSASGWHGASLGVREEGNTYKITPRNWNPSWLHGVQGSVLTHPLFAEEYRRTYDESPGDPFLRVVGRSRYRCDAQREAVRAILSVPPGSTTVVNLPTGAGKSLCAHLPALLMSEQIGTSIVVVPTIALALDQSRAVRDWVGHETAYVGGESVGEQARRKEIRARIRDGTQRVLFASPESLLQSARPALYDAAKGGTLRLIVIDEAHMVDQWGAEFRSAFQEVAGLRTDLRRHVPSGARLFATVMLTATLTETALDTLETLFGEPGPFVVVSSAQLRPEPSYWPFPVRDTEEQAAVVFEAVRHLPRPLLLYVTEPVHAEQWRARLASVGYRRVDLVSGRTPNSERSRVIERWREADTDIVVATSAFGLGVDQLDVRAVIHATLPENVDRFYQEVGRGGRDGAASASIVVYTPEDVLRAESLNKKKIIGIERGQERWSAMFGHREDLGRGRIRVPIDVQPSLRPGDINMENDLNRAWNIRTLTLMSRVRLLRLDAEAPPAFSNDSTAADDLAESQERYKQALLEQERHRIVSLSHDGTLIGDVWEREVEPARRRTRDSDSRNHTLMLETVSGSRCVGDILVEAYTIRPRGGDQPRPGVHVAAACGGCHYCRTIGRAPYAEQLPVSLPRWPISSRVGAVLNELRGDSPAVMIFYDTVAPLQLSRFIRWVVEQGVRVAVMPESALVQLAAELYQSGGGDRWVFTYVLDGFRFMRAPQLPSLVFLPPGDKMPAAIRREVDTPAGSPAVRLLLAPSATIDPVKPHALLRTTASCRTFTFEDFCTRIGL